jgi:hypothetical protein
MGSSPQKPRPRDSVAVEDKSIFVAPAGNYARYANDSFVLSKGSLRRASVMSAAARTGGVTCSRLAEGEGEVGLDAVARTG